MIQQSRNLFKKLLSGVPLNTKPEPLSTNCTFKVDFLKLLYFFPGSVRSLLRTYERSTSSKSTLKVMDFTELKGDSSKL